MNQSVEHSGDEKSALESSFEVDSVGHDISTNLREITVYFLGVAKLTLKMTENMWTRRARNQQSSKVP